MALLVQLLGPPLVIRDGVIHAAPKGKKVWALLAYLALSERAPSRQELVDLLFPEAEDPAGALRWNLSELRRLLGGSGTVGSANVVGLRLPQGSVVDVHVLMTATSLEAVELDGLGRELLEGVDVEASPGFTAWLLGQRRRVQGLSEAVLREGALRAVASGNAQKAVALATRLVAIDPLNEDAHVLLIRSFAGTGDETAVRAQLAASIDVFRRELGIEPGPELAEAARLEPTSGPAAPAGGRNALRAILDSGEAAITAGAVRVALDAFRRAVTASHEAGDADLEATACLSLGSALVHAAKGKDEEGAAALHRAIAVAETTGDRAVAAAAHRELGYIEILRGDYVRARTWLSAAEELVDQEPSELSWIRAVSGTCLADVGGHDRAVATYEEAIRLAEALDQRRQQAWSLTFIGRTHLLRNQIEQAEDALSRAGDLCRSERWTAFLPFPEALLAEVWVRQGDLDRAGGAFEHAFTLASQVDDACWEAYGVRGFGLLKAAQGDLDGAVRSMDQALTRCGRQRDTHLWIRAYVLDGLCAVALAAGNPTAERWVADLASLTARSGMQELSVRGYLYLRDLGDGSASEAARVLAADVENPHLHELIEPGGPALLDDLLGKAP